MYFPQAVFAKFFPYWSPIFVTALKMVSTLMKHKTNVLSKLRIFSVHSKQGWNIKPSLGTQAWRLGRQESWEKELSCVNCSTYNRYVFTDKCCLGVTTHSLHAQDCGFDPHQLYFLEILESTSHVFVPLFLQTHELSQHFAVVTLPLGCD